MGQYLIDNNIISNYFSGLFPIAANIILSDIIDQVANISVVTEIEALSWLNPDKSKEKIVKEFIQDSNVIPLTAPIVSLCVAIRRGRKINTPDAIIAATAIFHKFTLITSGSDFKKIPDLLVMDPFEL